MSEASSDEIDDRPVLSRADQALLKSAHAPTDAQISASRLAIAARLAALTAGGGAVASVASSAKASGAAASAASGAASSTMTGAATATTVAKTAAAFGAAKWFIAGVLVSAVAGGAVVATQRSARQAPVVAAPVRAPSAARVEAAAQPVEPAAQPAVSAAVATPIAPLETASVAKSSVAKPSKAPRRIARLDGEALAFEGETLAGELSLLRNARQALERGDARTALRELDAHAARYAAPVLRQEALAARALALCATGRATDARRAATQLARIAPRSPHLIALADSCALEDGE